MRATQSRAKLRDMLGAEIVADNHVSVPASFVADFEAVCARYQVTPEEKELMRQIARGDIENAIVCFAALAREAA